MKKAVASIVWFGGFGCLPFWVALVWLLVNGIGQGDDYWVVAPWVVVVAIPLSVITLAMAAITLKVYVATSGDAFRKLRYAGGCYAALWAAALVTAWFYWSERKADEVALEAQKEAGQALVERSSVVARVAPPGSRVGLSSWAMNRDGTPIRFYYFVNSLDAPDASLMVIVEPAKDSTRELNIRCVVPIGAYEKLESRAEPCELSEAITP